MTQRCGPTGACTEQSSLRAVQWQHLQIAERHIPGAPEGQAEILGLLPLPAPRRARVEHLPRRLLETPVTAHTRETKVRIRGQGPGRGRRDHLLTTSCGVCVLTARPPFGGALEDLKSQSGDAYPCAGA